MNKTTDKNYIILCHLIGRVRSTFWDPGDLELILDKSGYDLNYQIPDGSWIVNRKPKWLGYTLLHFAVKDKEKELIDLLLSRGADFTLKADNGFTPLRLALEIMADEGHFKNISTLSNRLECQSQLDLFLSAHMRSKNATNPSCNGGISHFHIACLADNEPAAKLFLEHGVPVNESINVTSDLFPGWSPLHFAVRYGSEELVKLLLTHGADVNRGDGKGLTPLRLLVELNIHYNVLILLGETESSITEIKNEFPQNDALIDIFINKDGHDDVVDEIGMSFFHVSCTKQDTALAEKFLKLGADVNRSVNADSPNWPGYTPAHFAAHCNPKIFELLVKNGADIAAKDAKSITPIDLLIERYKPTYVSTVLKLHPISKDIRFENGVKLVDVISSMRQESNFAEFMRNTSSEDARLPMNSPLWPGYTIMHLLVVLRIGNEDFIETCFSLKASDVKIKDANGMTPLHLAFHLGDGNIVVQILEKMEKLSNDCLINSVDQEGLSHLQIACIVDKVDSVIKFLKLGFDPNSPIQKDLTWGTSNYRSGSTLYHIAAINVSKDMVDVISKANGKINLLDDDGLTAVHVGFLDKESIDESNYKSNDKTLSEMLNLSMNQKINYIAEKAGRLSHLHVACNNCCFDVSDEPLRDLKNIEELASVATDINASIDCGIAIGYYAEKLAKYDGWTPLHFAVKSNFLEAIDVLINKGADVCARNAAGLNSLHLALKSRKSEVVKRLYRELKIKGVWPDNFGFTKLHFAFILKDENEIESLLKDEENVNLQIDAKSPMYPGDTALHIAIRSGLSNEIIQLFLKKGADLTLKNADNCTPFYLLWKANEDSLFLNSLLKKDSRFYKVNPSNDDGLSHFHISCTIGNVDIVNKFIDSGVNVNESVCPFAWEYAGYTPLHFAVKKDNKEVVELLLQSGADWKLENLIGRTPIQCAAASGSSSMLAVIFSHDEIDIQAENFLGKTALELLLTYNTRTFRELSDIGSIRINFADPSAKKVDIAKAAWTLSNKVFRQLVERATDMTKIDADGRNVVHSIGSLKYNSRRREYIVDCALNVSLWLEKGCDPNLQDKLGRTPLHDAAITGGAAINVLLLLGADINVRDNQGRTAFSYLKDDDYYPRRSFLDHILKMSCCGLELDDCLDEIVRREYDDESEERINCNSDLARMTNVDITDDLSLRDLLREKIFVNFPRFHVTKREVILDFLRPQRLLNHNDDWEDWNTIFQLQYRKILQTMQLLEPALKYRFA